MCARSVQDVRKMCARCVQGVHKMCARCAKDVCKMCARSVQGVRKMCARCAHYVCKMYAYVMFDIIEPRAFRKYSTCWVLENLKSLTCRIPLRGCFFCGGELSRQICVNTSPRQTCFVCRIFHKKKHLVGLESMTKFSLPGQN